MKSAIEVADALAPAVQAMARKHGRECRMELDPISVSLNVNFQNGSAPICFLTGYEMSLGELPVDLIRTRLEKIMTDF